MGRMQMKDVRKVLVCSILAFALSWLIDDLARGPNYQQIVNGMLLYLVIFITCHIIFEKDDKA
jgi:hypothetical protein